MVERAVQEVEGIVRSLFLGMEERLGKLNAKERIVMYIPEHAAYLLNRLIKRDDGKVPYERIKGKKPTNMGIEFGEKVLYKVMRGPKLEKINARWEYGIFVGVRRRRSGEVWIATRRKILSACSVRRIPMDVDRSRLRIDHPGYDHKYAEEDMNANLPFDRLNELVDEGVIGSLSRETIMLMGLQPNVEPLIEQTIPEIGGIFQRDEVDLVLLVPS